MINRENQLMHYVKHGLTDLAFDYFIDNYSTNTYAKLAHLDGLRSLKNNAIVLCTLLTRAALGGGVDEVLAFSRSDQFIIDIEAMDKNEQIAFLMCDMVKLFAELVSDKILSNQSITIDHILKFMHQNYAKKITLKDLATNIGLSQNYISSLFNKEMNKSFTTTLNEIRIEYSRLLLKDTTVSLAEISTECGFSTPSYFSKVFKQITDQTPLSYRHH